MLADELRKIAVENKAQAIKSRSQFLAKQIIEIAKAKTAQGETLLEVGSSAWKFSIDEAQATINLLKEDGFKCELFTSRMIAGGSLYDHQYESVIRVNWA